jgi:hypothetical protein
MGKVEQHKDAVHHGISQGDQGVKAAPLQAVYNVLEKKIHSGLIRANGFIKFVFSFVADPDNNGTFDWISLFRKGHIAGDALEVLDFG